MRKAPRFLSTLSLAALVALVAATPLAAQMKPGLTPVGAEKAANADASIPAWDGGITKPPAGYAPGRHYVDPFAADKPLFTITQQNAEQYGAKLSDGHKAMLKAYASFRMNVYPTRRSASAPQSRTTSAAPSW
jgi:hypothetical protein